LIPESRFTDGVPQWESFDKFARSWPSRLAWAALYFSVYWQFANVWWLWLLLPLQFLMSPSMARSLIGLPINTAIAILK